MGDRTTTAQMEADKKKIREELSLVEEFFMFLMPVSQLVAWVMAVMAYLGHVRTSDMLLYLAVFHFVWALKNRLLSNPHERGHYAFAILACGAFFKFDSKKSQTMVQTAGVISVLLAFVVASTKVLAWPPPKVAHVFRKTLQWAYILRLYYRLSIAFWSVALILIWADTVRVLTEEHRSKAGAAGA